MKLVHDADAIAVGDPEALNIDLDELCRVAAQDMLAVSLLAERPAYLEAHADLFDASGNAWWWTRVRAEPGGDDRCGWSR